MQYKEINDLRKKGFLEEATRIAEYGYAASPGKLEATALFWCLNDRLQRSGYNPEEAGMLDLLNRMKDLRINHDPDNPVTGKALSVAESMMRCDAAEREGWQLYQQLRVSASMPVDEKWPIINQYADIMSNRPSLLNSLMMAEAVKMEKSESRGSLFLNFTQRWDLDNLRPDDWVQRDGKEGHKQSSLVEKIIGAYMVALANASACPDEKFKRLLVKAIETYPSNLHLYRHSARLMAIDGNKEKAIEVIRRMLERTPDKHYLWDDMAKLVDDFDLRIGMLCNSIIKSKTDEISLNMRIRLAESLCEKRFYSNALTELNKFREVIEAHGWMLKRRYFDVLRLVPHGTFPTDNTLIYTEYTAIANAFAFERLPSSIFVKVWVQRNGSASNGEALWLMRSDEEELWIKPQKYCLDAKAHNGSIFSVYRSTERQAQIICIVPSTLDGPLPWLKIVRAPISIKKTEPSKVYGFVDGAYVPASMLYGLSDGTIVSAIVIRNENNRWNALYIYK